jgi:molybdopterin-binding protein
VEIGFVASSGVPDSRRTTKSAKKAEPLLRPREAALLLKISYPTIKQWIYRGQIRAVQTAGGHYRIPQREVDKFLYRTRGRNKSDRRATFRWISGRNQLVGRIVDLRISGLMAQVTLDVGGQLITSIITAGAVREMGLKKGQVVAALVKATEVMILRV